MIGTSELRLDGNAIGGLLLELFGAELTAAPCVCAGCGACEEMARLDVYVGARIVVRCRHCESVMVRIVQGQGRTWLDSSGASVIELALVAQDRRTAGVERREEQMNVIAAIDAARERWNVLEHPFYALGAR
jgi:hypothetical protein